MQILHYYRSNRLSINLSVKGQLAAKKLLFTETENNPEYCSKIKVTLSPSSQTMEKSCIMGSVVSVRAVHRHFEGRWPKLKKGTKRVGVLVNTNDPVITNIH